MANDTSAATNKPPPILEETVREDANRLIWNCANNRSFIRVLSPPSSLHSHTKWPRYLCHLALQSSTRVRQVQEVVDARSYMEKRTFRILHHHQQNNANGATCVCDFLLCRLLLSPFPPQPHTNFNRPEIGMDGCLNFVHVHALVCFSSLHLQ